jgi:hypothetical protein
MAFAKTTKKKDEIEFSFESILNEHTQTLLNEVEEEVDIITFCEHPYYLDQPLHGVERFILKSFYGIPLNDKEKTILLRSYPFDKEGKHLTEVEYAEFLIQQGRTNLLDPRCFKAALELVLPCGRRGGKTFIASIISAYEAYKLIVKGDPQKYYKLPKGEQIGIVNIASDENQALILAAATQNRILNSRWFVPYIEGKTENEIRLRSKKDLEFLKEEKRIHGRALDKHSSILIEAKACTSKGIRGTGVIVAILDEIAHYVDNDGNKSGTKIYESFTPATATFGLDAKILCISSPYTKGGIFYDLFFDAKGRSEEDKGDQNKRMFQIPTWEMNESITFEFLDSEKKRNPESFPTEFGAEFSSTITGFFKFPEKIDECIVRKEETHVAEGNNVHYIAVDPAASCHGYTLAMVHVENRERDKKLEEGKTQKVIEPVVVLDKWMVWRLSDPEFTGLSYIDVEVIEEYIKSLTTRFRIGKIVYDQFDSSHSITEFQKMGLNASKTPFSRQYNMKIFGRLRTMFYENRMELFDCKDGIAELKALQEIKVGKKEFRVEAPRQGVVTTDDMADVLANATFIALEEQLEHGVPTIVGTNGSQTFRASGSLVKSLHAYRRRLKMHGFEGNYQKAVKSGAMR